MKKADQIIGVIVLLFSGLVIEESWRMSKEGIATGTEFAPGPEFLSLWAGILLASLSVVLIVSASLWPADPKKKAIFPSGRTLMSVVLLMASLAAYIFMLDVIGYLTGTFLLIGFLLRVVMRGKWKSSLLVALLASVSLYVIFQVMLEVRLPKNMFGF
jgi:putative tricarboxylic transport membrane protein